MSNRNLTLPTTAAVACLLLFGASGASAQQSLNQQKCLNMINKNGTLVAKEQSKENNLCLKGAGMGQLVGPAQTCLTADAKQKVQKKKDKTSSDATKFCGTPPGFGYTGAAAVNTGAVQAEVDLVADVFGANLDAAVIACSTSKAGCQCQQKVLSDVGKLADKKLAEFIKCKKTTLKNGATSVTSLRDCVNDAGTPGSIAADTKGMISKAVKTLNTDITKKCDMPNVTSGAFPGKCTGLTSTPLGTCLDVQVECRVCQMLNDMDGLFVNCDLFDDGIANASCASGTGPTPTPSPSPTPTPTPGPGVELKGALTSTFGRFNYNLTLGLPGANAACNTNFPGTHACEYSELQTAEGAGDLDGLKDSANMTVSSFWVIDPTAPILQQCNDDQVGGSDLNWEYGTADTPSRGRKVALTNATGLLGPLQTSIACNSGAKNWVGCCL